MTNGPWKSNMPPLRSGRRPWPNAFTPFCVKLLKAMLWIAGMYSAALSTLNGPI